MIVNICSIKQTTCCLAVWELRWNGSDAVTVPQSLIAPAIPRSTNLHPSRLIPVYAYPENPTCQAGIWLLPALLCYINVVVSSHT